MTQVPAPVMTSSAQTPPPAVTTTEATAVPRGIAETPSTLRSAAETESPSCLSQIGSMISSIVSSIFSLISSLWNCVMGQVTQATAPAAPARTPGEVISARAQRFFADVVSQNTQQGYPRKVAFLIKIDGRRAALFTQDLLPSTHSNPFREFCNDRMRALEGVLQRHPSLTPQSTVELSVADIRRHQNPAGRNPNERSSYHLFTATLPAVDNMDSISSSDLRHGYSESIPVHAAAQFCDNSMFANRTPDEDRLHTAFMHFITNQPNATNGLTVPETQ